MNVKIWITLAQCLIVLSATGQKIQVYNGDYTLNSIGAVGTAKYSYYENEDFQRIYSGDFTLSVEKGNFSCVINGKFKNDLRDGKWTITGSFGYPQYQDFVTTISYLEGHPNGIWTTVFKKGDEVTESDKRVLNKGLLIDTWEFSSAEQKSTLMMKFDKEGVVIEFDMVSSGRTQNISKCKLGYEILTVAKNIQTGVSDVKKVEDPEILDALSKIEHYMKECPDSLMDVPYKLERYTMMGDLGGYIETPYMLTFTKDIRGAVLYEGRQFYGLYLTRLVKQKTREEIRIEEEKRLAELKLAEEKRLLEEKKKRIATEAAKTVNIETFNPDLYQSISGDINSGCRLFLSNLVKENFSTPLSFECSVVMTWSPEAIPGFTMAYGNGPEWVKAFSADNVTPFLYYQPKYSIAETAVPESFRKVFETDKLANIEKEFEGEKFKMKVYAEYKGIKIDYITSQVAIKLSKEKEITWESTIPEEDKKAVEEKIRQMEKGKYSLNYRIGMLNGVVVETAVEQIMK